ncbi:MAG TPA: hypothetical protein VH207_04190, partial [Chthoniobacterales bacterium]|nr:hypothetical protein [Chthoniobacterales bacterium]
VAFEGITALDGGNEVAAAHGRRIEVAFPGRKLATLRLTIEHQSDVFVRPKELSNSFLVTPDPLDSLIIPE